MLYSATQSLSTGNRIIMDQKNWLRPHDVEQILGVKWTRPRRTRILNAMAKAGVVIERPVPGSTLIDPVTLTAYLDDIKTGKTPTPDWYNEIQAKV